MPRRFITRTDIDEIADAGQTELLLDELTTVTDIAREHARERGVRLVKELAPPPSAPGPGADVPAGGVPAEELEATVRAAVIGRLGHAPDGLDTVLHRVLADHT